MRDSNLKHIIYIIDLYNKTSKETMLSTSGKVHRETRITFKNHSKLNTAKIGRKIALRLNVLRKYRNMVDYDSKNPKDLKHAYNRCQAKSKRIFELLEELT